MFNRFDHYLSYGSTDQKTVRDLRSCFNGLLVPGTIAAFQAEGTKGFILSLSARSEEPYVIDSRFPLFQNRLANPKQSHEMLAAVLGAPELVNGLALPSASDIDEEVSKKIAQSWIDFNVNFEDVQLKTFEKYAARLNEEVSRDNRKEPEYILPPYTMVTSRTDGWWEVSTRFWSDSIEYSMDKSFARKLRRVVAARDPQVWSQLASEVPDLEIVGWVSNLNELNLNSENMLIEYGTALSKAQERGQKVFALYGGFFSVLLSRYGLTGASHGIGFGEHRDSIELPTSGAPPARYYVPRLHRYIGVDIAVRLWRQFPHLISCDCAECNNESPAALDYHALMRHSVRCRHREIQDWVDMPTALVIERLEMDSADFAMCIRDLRAPSKVVDRAMEVIPHLEMWARAIRRLG